MRILIAPNSFKGSLDAFGVAEAIADGLARSVHGVTTVLLPVADGGDFTTAVLVRGLGGRIVESTVLGPLGRKVTAAWGMLDDGTTAVIEVAQASGLSLLRTEERDPMIATSYGAGELVSDALSHGRKRIIVGLGGSATVDGGAGLAEALGARFLDANGAPVARGGAGLAALERIDVTALDARLGDAEIVAACDVDNPLLGEDGAAKTYGPQKGATPDQVEALESNLSRFADVIHRGLGRDVRRVRHGGAAGGMAAGIAGILGGRLASGIDLVLDCLGFDERLRGCDLVVTAEGFLDRQTLENKAPYGVARAAERQHIPVVVMAGGIADDVTRSAFSIFDAIVPICPRPMSLDEAMSKTRDRLTWSAEQLGRILSLVVRRSSTT